MAAVAKSFPKAHFKVGESRGFHDLAVYFFWVPENPHVVEMAFIDESKKCVYWSASRELMHEGLDFTAGEGDIGFSSYGESFGITLRPPKTTQVYVLLEKVEVENFLADTYRLVPYGQEQTPIDTAALNQLLNPEL